MIGSHAQTSGHMRSQGLNKHQLHRQLASYPCKSPSTKLDMNHILQTYSDTAWVVFSCTRFTIIVSCCCRASTNTHNIHHSGGACTYGGFIPETSLFALTDSYPSCHKSSPCSPYIPPPTTQLATWRCSLISRLFLPPIFDCLHKMKGQKLEAREACENKARELMTVS